MKQNLQEACAICNVEYYQILKTKLKYSKYLNVRLLIKSPCRKLENNNNNYNKLEKK